MLYTQKTFTCPASSGTSQVKWDLAFLTPREFRKKYGLALSTYNKVAASDQGPVFERYIAIGAQ